MTQNPITLSEDDSISVAIESLLKYKIHRLPIVNTEGKLAGIVTLGGILRAIAIDSDLDLKIYTHTIEAASTNDGEAPSGNFETATSIMSTHFPFAKPDTSVEDCFYIMGQFGTSGLPVLDLDSEKGAFPVVGWVSGMDVLASYNSALEGLGDVHFPTTEMEYTEFANLKKVADKFQGRTAESVMSKKVVTIDSSSSLEDIAGTLAKFNIRRLPVRGNGTLRGIVSRHDVLAGIHRKQQKADERAQG